MEIASCLFPDDLLYDFEENVWVKIMQGDIVLGINCVYAFIAGRLQHIRIKTVGTHVEKGKSVATIESPKYFGVVKTPISGQLIEVNEELVRKPVLANRRPYTEGWFVKIRPNPDQDAARLMNVHALESSFREKIGNLRVRCFRNYPDYEISGIGGECLETLRILDDLMRNMKDDELVHLATDDPSASKDVPNWISSRSHRLVEERKESFLLHFIIGK